MPERNRLALKLAVDAPQGGVIAALGGLREGLALRLAGAGDWRAWNGTLSARLGGKPLAAFWMHNGFVRVDNEKMSKSLGNFFTIREVLQKYDPEVVRFFILRAHYRSPLNYSDAHLDDARTALSRLYTALKDTAPDALPLDWEDQRTKLGFSPKAL